MSTKDLTNSINKQYDINFLKSVGIDHSKLFSGTISERPVDKYSEFSIPGFDVDKYSRLGEDINPLDPTLDQQLADSQGRLEQLGAALNQAVVGEIVGGTIEAAGSLLDLFDGSNYTDTTEKKWTNTLTDLGQNLRTWSREATPIYEQHPGEFAPWSFSWWMSNAPSVASTVSLLLPSFVAVKGLSLGAKMLHMGQALEKVGMSAAKIEALGNTTSRLLQAGISRQIENTMESGQSYTETFDKYINSGYSEEDAKKYASTAAANTYAADWAMLAMDAAQYLMLPKFKTRADVDRTLAKAAAKQGLPTESLAMIRAKGLKNLAGQMAGEAFEEGYQFVAQEEGKYMADKQAGIADDSEFDQRIGKYLTKGGFWTAATMGALGGGVFKAIGTPLQRSMEKSKGIESLEEKRIKDVQSYGENSGFYIDQVEKAQKSTDPEDLDRATTAFINNFGGNAIKLGNTKLALDFLEGQKEALSQKTDDAALVDLEVTDRQGRIDMLSDVISGIKELETLTNQSVKKYNHLAPYVAESLLTIKRAKQKIPQLESEFNTLTNELVTGSKLTSIGQERIKLEADLIGLTSTIRTLETIMDDSNKQEKLPTAMKMRFMSQIKSLEQQVKEKDSTLKEITEAESYSSKDKTKDNKNLKFVRTQLLSQMDLFSRNRQNRELYSRQIEMHSERLEELNKPSTQKKAYTQKVITEQLDPIATVEELNEFTTTIDPKKVNIETIGKAIDTKRTDLKNKEIKDNDDRVTNLVNNPNVTIEELETVIKSSPEISDNVQELVDTKLQQLTKIERGEPIDEVPMPEDPTLDFTQGEEFQGQPDNVDTMEPNFDELMGPESSVTFDDLESIEEPTVETSPQQLQKNADSLNKLNAEETVAPKVVFNTGDTVVVNNPKLKNNGNSGIIESLLPNGKYKVRIDNTSIQISPENLNKVVEETIAESPVIDTKPNEAITPTSGLKSSGAVNGYNKENPSDKNYSKQSTVTNGVIIPIHRIINTKDGTVMDYRPDMVHNPAITKGTVVETRIVENDWWTKNKPNSKEDWWKIIPIGIYINDTLVGYLQANSVDRKIIYDNLSDGNKVELVVSDKTYGFHNNVLTKNKKGEYVPYFSSVYIMENRAAKDGSESWTIKEVPISIAIITGTQLNRTIEASIPIDPATELAIGDTTIGEGINKNDLGQAYAITTDSKGGIVGFKLSTATLSDEHINRVLELIKSDQGLSAAEIVATNKNVPSSVNEDQTYLYIDDKFTIYYSKYNSTFVKVQNSRIGTKEGYATQMTIEAKEKDGKPYYDFVPDTLPNGEEIHISLNTTNVEAELREYITGKKYNINVNAIASTDAYVSKITGQRYNSYMDYLDSSTEGIERINSMGQQSILATDGHNDEGTMFNSSQLSFSGIKINNKVIEQEFTPDTEVVDEVVLLEKEPAKQPSTNPNEPIPDINAYTKEGFTDEDDNYMSAEELGIEETVDDYKSLNNYIESLSKEDIRSMLATFTLLENQSVYSIQDILDFIVEKRTSLNQSITSDNLLNQLAQYLKCF